MPLNQKIIASIICIFLLFNFFSGCMFFDTTKFNLKSSVIYDDEGFPSLHIKFNVTDYTTVELQSPNKIKLHSDNYYQGSHDVVIHLDDYRQNPAQGKYFLQVFNKYDNSIFENELLLNKGKLTINNIEAFFWQPDLDKDLYNLVGLSILVTNQGNLPIYPYTLEIEYDNKPITAYILPKVVLPRTQETLNCFTYIESISSSGGIFDLTIRDYEDSFLVNSTESFIPTDTVETIEYNWNYGRYTLTIPNVEFLYSYYNGLDRRILNDYAFYVFDEYDDAYIEMIAERLQSISSNTGYLKLINFIASFSQSINYAEDDPHNLSCEYPKYPVEILLEKKGDCEDKAILTASILDILDYDVALLRLPDHMAIGVQGEEELVDEDYYYETYYYLDSTQVNAKLGFVPMDYRGLSNVTAHPISNRFLLVHSWINATIFSTSNEGKYVKMKIYVENIGRNSAKNVEVVGLFDSQYGVLNHENQIIPLIEPGEKKEVNFKISQPEGNAVYLKSQVYVNGDLVDEKESKSELQ